jgi:hypothetical protein
MHLDIASIAVCSEVLQARRWPYGLPLAFLAGLRAVIIHPTCWTAVCESNGLPRRAGSS